MGYIGKPVTRVEDRRLLCGRGRFVGNLHPVANVGEVAFVRSQHAHARIKSIDFSEAEKANGVIAVVTGEDATKHLRPFSVGVATAPAYWPIAIEVTRYVGEPIALVVATDRYRAEDAARAVVVDYELLDPEMDVLNAKVISYRHFSHGDVEGAFQTAAHRVKGRFHFPRYSSTPIECYAVIADWDQASEEVTIWSNFHGPFLMQPLVAASLKLSDNHVRFLVPEDIGGSFGIKSGVYAYMPLIALASKLANRPVRWFANRYEDLVASQAGTDRVTDGELGLDRDGRVVGLRLNIKDDIGAYLRPPEPATLYRCYGNLTGPYLIDNVDVEARAVSTNRAPTGLNRGFGGQQLYFTLERLMDKAAREVGLTPVELRRRNLVPSDRLPYRTPLGGVYDSGDYLGQIGTLVSRPEYAEMVRERDELRAQGKRAGVGIAFVVDPSGTNLGYIALAQTPSERAKSLGKSGCTETASITMDPSGNVRVRIATAPEGQGHETVTAQIVADQLGLPLDAIKVYAGVDTATQVWNVSSGSYSSRFAPIVASAVIRACGSLRARILQIAAGMLEAEAEDLELLGGQVRVRGTDRRIPIRRVAGLAHWDPGALPSGVEPMLHAVEAFSSEYATAPASDDTIDSSICYAAVVDSCLVAVDSDTGQAVVRKYLTVHDSGRILNPLLADGQVHGALAHGLGGALFEELIYDESGTPLATSFQDYLCPTPGEVLAPSIVHLESSTAFVPSGAKGIGEGNAMSAPAAIANALTDALGVDIDELPASPDRIWQWLRKTE